MLLIDFGRVHALAFSLLEWSEVSKREEGNRHLSAEMVMERGEEMDNFRFA